MRCLAVCHSELVIRTLAQVLPPSFDVDFLVESRPLAKRLHDAGLAAAGGDLRKTETYVRADVSPGTCVLIEDHARRSPAPALEAVFDAGAALVYLLEMPDGRDDGARAARQERLRNKFPELSFLSLPELVGPPLVNELSRSMTRGRVQQYQRYFNDANRILILLHNDPDPDAMASGLALRNLLRRTKTTAIIGALQGVTRPENLRMVNLLDIQVETVTPQDFGGFDRVAMVDVQPHYFGGLVDRVDLVIDHHPPQPGYSAVFRDIRPDYGSTCTILTEHLRAVDVNISERTATAMLYAIKSDTLFFNRQANAVDIEAFSYLYPLADAAMIRKMEGAELTLDRLEYVARAYRTGCASEQVFCAFLGAVSREDFIPYVADFFLQVEDVKWTFVSGVVGDNLVIAVRNLGYARNAGELVRKLFSDIGSAGGHRAMAKAVIPVEAFRGKYHLLSDDAINLTIRSAALQVLREHAVTEKKKDSPRT
ncbi:MAG TPA: DHH family phosphoesterase [Vicinamibacterales bacterium]|nr:DHH family phosphoesterase [Vicinamibacterales bacterium]HPW20962.1 DHH family phosphoesterase [Vicinamibacterales bacterium]